MAKPPKTRETAKVGETFKVESGVVMQKVQSPYSPGETMSVVARPTPAAPKPRVRVPAAAAIVPGIVNAGLAMADHLADSYEDAHRSKLAERQVEADDNDAKIEELHAQLDAPPPPPPPVPTLEQQAQPTHITAGAVARDIGRGIVETPSMVGLGVRKGVGELIAYSDHLADLADQHIPLGRVTYNFTNDDAPKGVFFGADAAEIAKAANIKPGVGGVLDSVAPIGEEDHSHSVTGAAVEGLAQFATGWAAGGGILKGWKAAAGAGAVVKGMAQGALADFGAFDAHQARFSDFLKEHVPDAARPVFDYLASDPRDGETEGRLKLAIEGLGLGVITHGIISAARQLRSARITQRAAALSAQEEGLQGVIDAPHAAVEAASADFHKELMDAVGDPKKKGFLIKRKFPLKPGDVADAVNHQHPNSIGLNYTKISDADDMQAAAVQFYDAFHSEITAAKRGVQSIEQQIDDAFGVDVSRLLGTWEAGTAFRSHELTALRFAQAAALKDFLGHANAIANGDSTLAKQAAFLQTGGVLDAMTRAVEGGKAEAARTLRTLRETVPSMVGDSHTSADAIRFFRQVDALVAGAGGKEMVERAAKQFLAVAKANPLGTSKFLRGIQWYAKFADKSKDVMNVFMTNGLLSIPGNVANVVGNASALVWEPAMRGLAPFLSDAVGAGSHIAPGEHIAMMAGMKAAFGDIFRLGEHINGETVGRFLGDETGLDAGLGVLPANIDKAKADTKAFSTGQREEVKAATGATGPGMKALERGPEADTALGRVAEAFWDAVKIPGRANGLMDDFTKIISGRAELHAQAYRKAVRESETGLITRDQIGAQMQKHIEDPDGDMLERVVFAQRELSWTREADTKAGDFTRALGGLRAWANAIPVPFPVGTAVLPFVRTPANVFSYGMRNSTFAPLSARWWDEMRSTDGATRQLALTKYAMGSLVSLWVMDQVANGKITGGGPHDPAQKQAMSRIDPETSETMWQPYSFRVGDRWFDYGRLDPLATNMAVAADVSEAWLGNDWTADRAETGFEVFAVGAMSIGNAFMNKSTMQGMSQLMDALAGAKQGNVNKAETFMAKRAVAAVPFSSVMGSLRREDDPYMREVSGFTAAFKNQVPGLSSTLPASYDLWGRHRTYESGMGSVYDFVIPARSHAIGGEPADREMLRLGYAKQMPQRSISLPGGKTANLRNYPTIYNEILTRGGPPALAEINDLVTGAHPNSAFYESLADGSDQNAPGSKARYLKGRLDFYFRQATQSVRQDFANELRQIAEDRADRRAEVRLDQ